MSATERPEGEPLDLTGQSSDLTDESSELGGAASASSPAASSDETAPSDESSDVSDALAHADLDDASDDESGDAAALAGACPMEPELPLLLYEGDLEPGERERLQGHVRKCARCEGALAELEATLAALDKAPLVVPRAEKWTKLKANVLARAAEPASKSGPEPAKAPPVAKPAASATPSEAVAAAVCSTFEEDLLFVNDLAPARRAEVLAHVAACAGCRETQAAFGSLARSLDAVPVELPAAERWEGLKANVLAQVGIEAPVEAKVRNDTRSRERPKTAARATPLVPAQPITRESLGRRAAGWFLRSAAVILVFGLGVYASDAFRGVGSDALHRAKAEADGSGDLAVALRNYELVVREGADRPELAREVDESLVQLAALRRYSSLGALSPDSRRAELVNVIAQFPESLAARYALSDYMKTLDAVKKSQRPEVSTSGFRKLVALDHPGPAFEPNATHVQLVDPKDLKEKIVAIKDVLPEREVQGVLAAAELQKAIRSLQSDPQTAKLELQAALAKADEASPTYLAAKRRLDAIIGAGGN